MNINRTLALAAVVASSLAVGLAATHTSSAAAATACTVNVTGYNTPSGRYVQNAPFTFNSDKTKAALSITLTGDANCSSTVTLASWTAPNNNFDLANVRAQKLYAENTQTYGRGTHVIDVAFKDCYYQLDLVKGSTATAANGTADYQYGGNAPDLYAAKQGGTQGCETKTPPTPVKPAPVCDLDKTLPANSPKCAPCEYNGKIVKDSKDCKAPETPVTPTTPTTPTTPETPATPVQEAPVALPNTGAGSVAAIAAFIGLAGYAANLLRLRLSRR